MGLGVWGLGFGDWVCVREHTGLRRLRGMPVGSGITWFGVWDFGFWVWDLGFGILGFGFWVLGLRA